MKCKTCFRFCQPNIDFVCDIEYHIVNFSDILHLNGRLVWPAEMLYVKKYTLISALL